MTRHGRDRIVCSFSSDRRRTSRRRTKDQGPSDVLFTEPTFLFVFLPILLALYQLPGVRYRNWLLLAASIIFYTRGAGNFTWLVLALIVFNYVAARLIDRHRATVLGRRLLAGAVAIDLLVLAVFKYADFAVGNLNAALALVGVQPFAPPGILLPIGISFFTFHAISYVVDVYRQDASAQKRPVKAALYLLVFPQLIAGPIVRYRQIAEQLSSRVTSLDDFAYGVRRFIIGLSKKMLIANTLAGPADQIFAMPAAELTALHAWTGVVCYTLQIYFDFSGYSDMAIGLGRMFGFRFPENFNYPYTATSIQDFWRRWHMSLSALVPRLRVHPARRQPHVDGPDVLQPRARVLPVWPLARRQLDVRRVGSVSRGLPHARARGAGRSRRRVAETIAPRVCAAGGDGRLGLLPRRHAGERRGDARGHGGRRRRVTRRLRTSVVLDHRCASRPCRRRRRINAGDSGTRAAAGDSCREQGSTHTGLAWIDSRAARTHDGARGVADAVGGAQLQPVHLFPILKR